jgi:voltage-gated potassium channel Kch
MEGTTVILAGPDDNGLAEAFAALGTETNRIPGPVTRESLLEAGIEDAAVLVLTDMDDASAIPVAKDENPDVRVVTYAPDSLPEFARGQTDLAVDPALLPPEVFADELV